MTQKHTPGPWVSSHYDDIGDEVVIQTHKGEYVASIDCDAAYEGKIAARIDADAHLISAAPDMLQALRFLRDNYDVGDVVNHIIAKAEGRI